MADTNENLGSALGTDIGFKMPKTTKEAFEKQAELAPKVAAAEADIKRQEMNFETSLLEAKGKSAQESADQANKKIEDTKDKMLLLPSSEFHPTKENAESLGQLFSMVATFGLMMGNSGKLAAQNAMGAMTGMLKGWQEGRQDLYERELKEYEKNYQKIKDMREDLRKDLEYYFKVAPLDKEAGQAQLEVIARKAGTNSVAGSYANKGNVTALVELYKSSGNFLEKQEELRIKKAESQRAARDSFQYVEKDGKVYAINKNNPNDIREVDPRVAGASTLGKDKLSFTKSYDKYFPGLVLDPKDKKGTEDKKNAIDNGALSLATAQDLIDYAKQHPDALGRQGQINQNVERYIKSFQEGKDLPTDNQPNLVFAKRYAAYLVGYERALAGGNKSMTVAFQKRFNELMSQNQFNSRGFEELMKQQMQEISDGVSAKDLAITGRGLVEYGQDIKKRGALPLEEKSKTPTLQEFLNEAKKVNPSVSDEDLTTFYKNKYVGK